MLEADDIIVLIEERLDSISTVDGDLEEDDVIVWIEEHFNCGR